MICKNYQCRFNSIHDEDRPKGYCDRSEDVAIGSTGECIVMDNYTNKD